MGLFEGISGITLALSEWVNPVAFCEIDKNAQDILFSRMATGDLPNRPIWDDIKTFKLDSLPAELRSIDIIYGGFPCQDISEANPFGKGLEGERSGLFYDVVRIAAEFKPSFIFLENVPAIKEEVPCIRTEFEAFGYECRDGFLSAAQIGKCHVRLRWWLLAHAPSDGRVFFATQTGISSEKLKKTISNEKATTRHNHDFFSGEWTTRADRVFFEAYGISGAVAKLRSIGNAVDVETAREAFKRLIGLTKIEDMKK